MVTYPNNTPEYSKLNRDGRDFDEIYLTYFDALHRYAYTIVQNEIVAEEMVHQMFWKILERSEGLKVHTSLKAYLYRSVHHECLNYLKHQKVRQNYESHSMAEETAPEEDASHQLQYRELVQNLEKAINGLPEQCRTIFQLSRFEDLKYSEIANQLGLSIKTVETQMSRALKKLRIQLAEYLPFIAWLFVNFF
ncbi:RNA polymerase sigma-70 factor (ECF subfamily) [Mucilaginibacter sp. SG538B]|uniref:RNA polymerase sigma-70 factor n=1 Tax=Mucilaginibacter sp. SG538B TaxID=2587021 RepID=UPI00159DF475|nr:RNA polymerase sigma-70 factor [Mucilaginibacter sp. SG538B]NVM66754.1 RNA polymerase sigma-70 factor (ECF subfamily) [Mucilaginibacter sp. SG538B]